VLVVDDEPLVRELLDILLSHKGYDVLLADDGWKGLELYRQEHPDVILLDLRMPGLDGVTVLKQIRSVDLEQPVIILTGDSTPETKRQVCELGASEFIEKGCSLHLITDVLQRHIKTPTLASAIPTRPGLRPSTSRAEVRDHGGPPTHDDGTSGGVTSQMETANRPLTM